MSDSPIGPVRNPGKAWSLSEPLKNPSFKGRLVGVWNCTPLLEKVILANMAKGDPLTEVATILRMDQRQVKGIEYYPNVMWRKPLPTFSASEQVGSLGVRHCEIGHQTWYKKISLKSH